MVRVLPGSDLFHGLVSLERGKGFFTPWRLPEKERALFPSPDERLVSRGRSPSGVRLRFQTDSPRIVLGVEPLGSTDNPRLIDLCRAGELLRTIEIARGEESVEIDLPEPGVYEIWLELFYPMPVRFLGVVDGSYFGPAPDERPRWTTYGSSITMCRTAASPAQTWPAVAARECRLNLTNLGFGGECHVDSMVGKVIRELPADMITLELGINVYGQSSLGARSYPAAVIGLVRTIREGQRRTPVGVITSIISPDREHAPNDVGCTLENYREMTRDAVERLAAAGDDRLRLFEGTELFGEGDLAHLPDGLHPNAEGYRIMGARFAETVIPPLLALAEKGWSA